MSYSVWFLSTWINAIRVPSGSCSISWILKSEGNHYRFDTTLSLPWFCLTLYQERFLHLHLVHLLPKSHDKRPYELMSSPLHRRTLEGSIFLRWNGVMSFCTKRLSTYTIFCFLLGFFFQILTNILLMLFLWVGMGFLFLVRSSSCHQCPIFFTIWHWFIIIAEVKKVSWYDTCVCFSFDDLHWIVPAHAPSVLGGTCNETWSKDPNVIVAWFDSTTSSRSDEFFLALQVPLWDLLIWNISPPGDWWFDGNDNSLDH